MTDTPQKTAPASEEKNSSGHNILIVEDDVFMAGLLERKFGQNDYKILKAASATQAREALSANPVDLILLDVILPGMDGFSFLHELKGEVKYKNIPVVITSNLGQQEEIERGISEGAADYVIKAHTSPGEIVEKVRNILEKN